MSKICKWTIYAIEDPLTHEIKYIGITSVSLKRRLQQHLRGKDHNPDKDQWIQSLLSQGLTPLILPLQVITGTRSQAEQCENYWVYTYIHNGHDVLNTKHIPGDRALFFEFLRNLPKIP